MRRVRAAMLLKAASGVCVVQGTLRRFEYWERPLDSSTRRSRALHSVSLFPNEWYIFYMYLLVHCSAP